MGSLKVIPDIAISDINTDADALILIGGEGWSKLPEPEQNKLAAITNSFKQERKIIGGICAAANFLAAHGLLNDVKHSGNTLQTMQNFPAYNNAVAFQEGNQAARTQNIVTAAGTAPISFALEVLRALAIPEERIATLKKIQ
ncbi:MAG: DJ-1/PfpI family protein [Cardiobacteriaceae bacterium]|nr:DJ-1/PfpI family protein [Cardiobacteriaceae bacterium]